MPDIRTETLALDKIVGGGQTLGTLADGKKAFVWGGLPGEEVEIAVTKKKSSFIEGVVTKVLKPSSDRLEPLDPDTYLSTSPWQIMQFEAEQRYKAALIEEAFELHHVQLPNAITIYSDGKTANYRNKVEFSWFGDEDENGNETLDLSFFKRGSKGKTPVTSCSLLPDLMMEVALIVRDTLHAQGISARSLKTLLIRCNQVGQCIWQLYVKDSAPDWKTIADNFALSESTLGFEIIYSDPRSPASRITERLIAVGETSLEDNVLGTRFKYAVEGFFQVNISVYEQALRDMKAWVPENKKSVDMYSGVGSIGLTIGGEQCTLVEIDEHAVREMRQNIEILDSSAIAVHAASEKVLEYITGDATIILDPPRAGLHPHVIEQLLEAKPERIVYLSCNPVTQARDVSLLQEQYKIIHHQGYNFFPRTPHIEHLVVFDIVR